MIEPKCFPWYSAYGPTVPTAAAALCPLCTLRPGAQAVKHCDRKVCETCALDMPVELLVGAVPG